MKKPYVSVIIPSYQSEKTIEMTLNSVFDQNFDRRYEVIVSDSSKDSTPEIIRKNFPDVKLFHHKSRLDAGSARNVGVDNAKGQYLLFTDSDCIVERDWIDKHVNLLEKGYDCIGGSVDIANPEKTVAWASYIAEFAPYFPTKKTIYKQSVFPATCNVSYTKEVFNDLIFFPSKLYAQEDLYFHWQLLKKNKSFYIDSSISVKHYQRDELNDFLKHQWRIGVGTSQVLRITDIEGDWIVKNFPFTFLLLTLLPIVKAIKLIYSVFKFEPKIIKDHFPSLLLFFVGLSWWFIGFVQGCLFRKTDIR